MGWHGVVGVVQPRRQQRRGGAAAVCALAVRAMEALHGNEKPEHRSLVDLPRHTTMTKQGMLVSDVKGVMNTNEVKSAVTA